MKKYLVASLASVLILQAGCAQRPPRQNEAPAPEQTVISENEQRIHELEGKVSALDAQIAQMNSRVYEVRTRSGQKTSMTVVPVNAPVHNNQTNVAASNANFANSQLGGPAAAPAARTQPRGRKVDPAGKPTAIPKKQAKPAPAKPAPTPTAGPSGTVGLTEATAGPTGQITAQSHDDLALPPAELPPAVVQAAQPTPAQPAPNMTPGVNASSTYRGAAQPAAVPAVPVPVLPESGLALPPETPGAVQQPAPAQPQSAAPASAPPKAAAASLPRGEQNAYNAALKAVRSGRINEGIRMFREFLQRYPNGRYAANADYWIGECLYQQGKYQDALSQFNTVNSSFPSHHKNADALLKAGLTLNKMGDNNGANEKFRAILASFPNSEAARRVRAMGIR